MNLTKYGIFYISFVTEGVNISRRRPIFNDFQISTLFQEKRRKYSSSSLSSPRKTKPPSQPRANKSSVLRQQKLAEAKKGNVEVEEIDVKPKTPEHSITKQQTRRKVKQKEPEEAETSPPKSSPKDKIKSNESKPQKAKERVYYNNSRGNIDKLEKLTDKELEMKEKHISKNMKKHSTKTDQSQRATRKTSKPKTRSSPRSPRQKAAEAMSDIVKESSSDEVLDKGAKTKVKNVNRPPKNVKSIVNLMELE